MGVPRFSQTTQHFPFPISISSQPIPIASAQPGCPIRGGTTSWTPPATQLSSDLSPRRRLCITMRAGVLEGEGGEDARVRVQVAREDLRLCGVVQLSVLHRCVHRHQRVRVGQFPRGPDEGLDRFPDGICPITRAEPSEPLSLLACELGTGLGLRLGLGSGFGLGLGHMVSHRDFDREAPD